MVKCTRLALSLSKGGELLAPRDITSWSHYDDGGYIGLWFIDGQNARLDDFGGGIEEWYRK